MFDTSKTYKCDLPLYKQLGIKTWECKTHETVDLGTIYKSGDSFIKAKVTPAPAQFYHFTIYDSESHISYEVDTGSGCLTEYFEVAKLLCTSFFVIKSKRKGKNNG